MSKPVRHIFRWDLDKTYLRTDFDTVRDLLRTALLKPEQRQNVPGTGALLRALTRLSDESRVVVTFISGSPEQMRSKIERKFALDGVRPDIFVLKPQLRLLLRGKFRAIRGQVGYKLNALLRIRMQTPLAPETLFGDDAEQDAFIYSLYADIVSCAISVSQLESILKEAQVYQDTALRILERASRVQANPTVERIFINLDRKSPPGQFLVFGPRVVPIIDYFQAAVVLYGDGILDARGLFQVVADMIVDADYALTDFGSSFQDIARRGRLAQDLISRLDAELDQAQLIEGLPGDFEGKLLERMRSLSPRGETIQLKWEGPPDYIEILRADRRLREAIKAGTPG